MKTFFKILAALILNVWTLSALGDGTPVVPASQAVVNAGTDTHKYVTPATLTGWTGASGISATTATNIVNVALTNLTAFSLGPPIYAPTNSTLMLYMPVIVNGTNYSIGGTNLFIPFVSTNGYAH